MKRNNLLAVFLLIFPVLAFSAGESEDAQGDQTISLTVSFFDNQREAPYEEIARLFVEENPNYEIDLRFVEYENYYTVINTGIQSGEAPDLMFTSGNKDSRLASLAEAGAILDLTDRIDVSAFPESLVAKTTVNGRVYSSPGGSYDVVPVYYNKDIYDELGLEEPETYQELLENCRVILEAGIIPFAIGGRGAWDSFWMLNAMITAMSTDWVEDFVEGDATFSDPRYVETHQALLTDIVGGGFLDPNFAGVDGAGAQLLFTQGRAAMIVDGSWAATSMTANPDVAVSAFHWPSREGGNMMLGSQETGFAVYSGSEHPEEAIAFLEFLMSKEAFQVLADLGVNVPALEGVTSPNPLIQKMTDFDEVVDQFWNYIIFYTPEGLNTPHDYVAMQQQVLLGDMSIDELVSAVDSALVYP